jgi:hypothetical protein
VPPRRILTAVAALALCFVIPSAVRHGAASPRAVPAPRAFAYAKAPADPAAGTFRFDASVTPINRQAFLAAAARVRPEAARLFDRVDGLVTVVDGEAGQGALGVTIPDSRGYTIRMAFGDVFQKLGQRGFDRVVQHELGHVVDFALVPDALKARLDAGIPPGQPCRQGTRTGSCAPREERFAESFAKWASGDLGVELYAGYEVPPPPDLENWGAPLAELAASGA